MKEETLCTFTQKGTRLQLVKLLDQEDEVSIDEITNTVGGYICKWSDGQETKIQDKEVELTAKAWGLHKDNENYYYRKSYNKLIKTKYQVRLNRKIISKSISEYTERKVFATYCQNIVLQLKIY